MRLPFSALGAEPGLRRRALRAYRCKYHQNENYLERLHEFACRDYQREIGFGRRIRTANQIQGMFSGG